MPRFYFDLRRARASLENAQTPWTPALSMFYGLDKAFESLRAEGLEGIYTRHHAVAQYTRDRIRGMGLELFAHDERFASDTVTAVRWPDEVDGPAIAKRAREEFGVVLGGGQQSLRGKIFRVGHLGYFTQDDIADALDVLERLLAETPARATA